MEKPREDSKHSSSNVFSLAVTVGLIVFFITSAMAGGLTGVQGFFIGLFVVILLFVVLGMLEGHQTRASEQRKGQFSIPGNVSITQSESEKEVSIHIYISRKSVLDQEVHSDR